jgi:anti-anti-sigma regulatory factor
MAASIALVPPVGFDLAIDFVHRTLKPCGKIDATAARVLLGAANAFLTMAVADLTIDLAEVTAADSALLDALRAIHNGQHAQGAGLWLVNEPSCVKRLFLASGFRAVLAG